MAIAKAHCNLSEVLYEDLCFDAQQAAEKSIKAVFLHGKLKLPRTHDILNMLGLLQRSGIEVPEEIRQADILTVYAVETRYPGLFEEVTLEEYLNAVDLAERVLRWAGSLVSSGSEDEIS